MKVKIISNGFHGKILYGGVQYEINKEIEMDSAVYEKLKKTFKIVKLEAD